MSFQFIREIIVIQALVPIVPQFNRSPVNLDVPIYIRAAIVMGQHIILRPYP